MDEPIGKLAYINECIIKNKVPEYWIIDNPFLNENSNLDETSSKFSNKNNTVDGLNSYVQHEDVKRLEMFSSNIHNEISKSILFKKHSVKVIPEHILKEPANPMLKLISKTTKKDQKNISIENSIGVISRIFNIGAHIPNEEESLKSSVTIKHIQSIKSKNLDEIFEDNSDPIAQYLMMIRDITRQENDNEEEKNISNDSCKIINYFLVPRDYSKKTSKNILQENRNKKEKDRNDYSNPKTLLNSSRSDLKIEKYIKEINDPIMINEVNRPFSINLRQLELNKNLVSSHKEKKDLTLSFSIKVQLYCGSNPFSNPRLIKWTGLGNDKNIQINKNIYFSLQYHSLPIFSSILVKVKHLTFNKKKEISKLETVAWTNFRLFDHNRRLKTGKILIINQGHA